MTHMYNYELLGGATVRHFIYIGGGGTHADKHQVAVLCIAAR